MVQRCSRLAFAAASLLVLACHQANARQLLQGTSVLGSSSSSSSHAVPGGYEYEGEVTFTHKLQPGPAASTMHAHLTNSSSNRHPAHAPPTHRTILITRDGHRYSKTLSLEPPSASSGFGEPRFPRDAGNASASDAGEAGRSLLQVNTNDFTCVGCPSGGPDTRTAVTDGTFPYSAIGQLMGQVTSNTALECTGSLIGDSHVLTAGHCVFDIHTTRKMVSNLDFSPGMNGNGHPNGVARWKSVRVLQQFTAERTYSTTAINYDFALITLASPVSPGLGYFGIQRGSGTQTLNIMSAGYPADKPTGTMWGTSCQGVEYAYGQNQGVFKDVSQCQNQACANILQHSCVASEGQSGASMWDPSSRKIHSILTGKLSTTEGNSYYVGTKMDAFVFDTLNAWYQEDAGVNSALPQDVNTGSSGGASAAAAATGGSASTSSFPGLGGSVTSTSSTGSSSPDVGASSSAATMPSSPPSIFGRVSSGGLFGGLSALFNSSSSPASPISSSSSSSTVGPATTVATATPASAPSAAQPSASPQNSVAEAQPTGNVEPLITTTGGISLVFDPLIRQPQQVAAALKQAAADLANGRR